MSHQATTSVFGKMAIQGVTYIVVCVVLCVCCVFALCCVFACCVFAWGGVYLSFVGGMNVVLGIALQHNFHVALFLPNLLGSCLLLCTELLLCSVHNRK